MLSVIKQLTNSNIAGINTLMFVLTLRLFFRGSEIDLSHPEKRNSMSKNADFGSGCREKLNS